MRSGVQNDDDVVAVKGCRVNHRATSLQVLLGRGSPRKGGDSAFRH